METPTPVDINKLRTILGNAKKIMKAADEKFPEKKSKNVSEGFSSTSTSSPIYDERDERDDSFNQNYNNYSSSSPIQSRDYTEEDVMNSKLPPIIKEAMLKNPIPKITTPPSKFSLEDLGDLIEKPRSNKQINESTSQNTRNQTITIGIDDLNEMIEKKVNETISKLFVKSISEQTIKKTLNTLISEGRLIQKKK